MMGKEQSVAIDLRKIHDSGIGTYLCNLVPLVIEASPGTRFSLLGPTEALRQFAWANGTNVSIIDCRARPLSIHEQFELPRRIPKGTTVFWAPHLNIPLLYRGKLLVTIHDVFHLAMPQLAGGISKRLFVQALLLAIRNKAEKVLSVSHFTENELVRLAGMDRRGIVTIHEGVHPSWFGTVREQAPHSGPYVMFVGNIKPNKNLSTLLKALPLIEDKLPHDLIIVGKREGFMTGDRAALADAEAVQGRVQFTGHISQQRLQQYYRHADALVFPSLYEGFGLPPLEAMACGCPVIASNAASLPEICGEAALYFDPRNPQDIAEKIERCLTDTSLREQMRRQGIERAAKFSWQDCAQQTSQVIRALLS